MDVSSIIRHVVGCYVIKYGAQFCSLSIMIFLLLDFVNDPLIGQRCHNQVNVSSIIRCPLTGSRAETLVLREALL